MPGRLAVTPAADLARLTLRGDAAALRAAYDIALPAEPCRAASAGDRTALWLGPDEWLLLAPPGTLDLAISVAGAAVVDIGHRQVGLVAAALPLLKGIARVRLRLSKCTASLLCKLVSEVLTTD